MDTTDQQPVQPVNNQPTNGQPPQQMHSEEKSFNWIKIVFTIVGLLAVTGIGVGGYYLGTKKNEPVALNQQIKVSQIPAQVTSTSDPTANWQTYKTDEYSIKYPTDWNFLVFPNGIQSVLFAPQPTIDKYKPSFEQADGIGEGPDLSVVVSKTRGNDPQYISNDQQTVRQNEIALSGMPAVEYTIVLSKDLMGFKAGYTTMIVVLKANGAIWQISLNDIKYKSAFQEMLATFKLSTSTAADISNWKTYTRGNFSIKYPADFYLDSEQPRGVDYIFNNQQAMKQYYSGSSNNPGQLTTNQIAISLLSSVDSYQDLQALANSLQFDYLQANHTNNAPYTQISVSGTAGIKITTKNTNGDSIEEYAFLTKSGSILITAQPADSSLMSQFEQMVQTLTLTK